MHYQKKKQRREVMIHVLRYTEELEKVGFSTEQAKKSVQLWMDLMDQNFATKADFKEHYFMTKTDLKDVQTEMKDLKSELQTEIKDLRTELKADIKELEHSLTVRLGVMLAASVGVISAIVSLKH